jgi:putative sterol carrier protein
MSELPVVTSAENYFETLPDRFVEKAAKGVKAVYQFELSGDGGGTWHVVIDDGTMAIHQGGHESPSATISAAADDYVKIVNGEINGRMAVFKGKMKVKGSIPAAMKMSKIIPQRKK